MNEQPFWIHPPYETDQQKHRFKQIRKNFTDKETEKFWRDKTKEEFLAGGGDPADLEKYNEIGDVRRKEAAVHFDNKEFYAFSGSMFFIIKGQKPFE